uniref:Uncharacterized protein n=1 Tax=Panagrolaimus sp. ES5 TaxID=591445 RepID=A0AC34FFU7_9BILA
MMADEKTSEWASLLPRVQLAKNSRFHSGIKLSPFEAMFGRKVSQIGNNHSDDVDDDAEASGSDEVDGDETISPDDTESAEDAGGSSSNAVEVEGKEVHAADTQNVKIRNANVEEKEDCAIQDAITV